MTQETENFLVRRRQWLEGATDIIQTHSQLLTREQARDIAKISLKAWQDLRSSQEWVETSDFLLTL